MKKLFSFVLLFLLSTAIFSCAISSEVAKKGCSGANRIGDPGVDRIKTMH